MNIKEIGKVHKLTEEETLLEVNPAHKEALYGIVPGDRLQILYWMHQLEPDTERVLKVKILAYMSPAWTHLTAHR